MRKYFSSIILYMLITVLVASLYLGDFTGMKKLQWKIDDILYSFRGDPTSAPDIVMVNIDDESIKELGEWPWSYDVMADIIATCNSGKPQTILVNMELPSRASQDTTGNTEILANQISWADNIILTYDIALADYSNQRMSRPDFLYKYSIKTSSDLGILDEHAALNIRKMFLPSGIICQYADGLGFDYLEGDEDRKIRWAPLAANYEGYYYPSAPLLAAVRYRKNTADNITLVENEAVKFGQYTIPTDDAGRLFINYNNPGTTFKEYSAVSILNDNFDTDKLSGKMVIIGLTCQSDGQFYATPVSKAMSKNELYANIVENIMHGNFITRFDMSIGLNLLILFGMGLFCALILPRVSILYRLIILVVCVFILANLSFVLFNSYGILIRSLYFGLQLMLFMLTCPLLDENRFGGSFSFGAVGSEKTQATPAPKKKQKQQPEEEAPVRVLNESASSLAVQHQETEMLNSTPPGNAATEAHVAQDNQAEKTVSHAGDAIQSPFAATTSPPTVSPSEIPQSPDIIGFEDSSRTNQPTPQETAHAAQNQSDHIISPASSSPSFGPGPDSSNIKSLGRYQIVGMLGKGAMGSVYKGVDPAINRPVALKTIRLDFVSDEQEMTELRDRLFREAQAAGKLSHPNIVIIYDVGTEGSLQYIAMEYLEGQTLEQLIKKQVQFSFKIIANIMTQICLALEYAHDQGIVHRDIKPANIMVLPDYSIKVMDFGIARVDSSSMTRTGIAMGTPNYIAPELLQGQTVDRRCDIFSLGVVIYELLTGRRPFKGENLTSLIYSIVNQDPVPPSTINENLPLIFDHITSKALAKNPVERYQKASDLRAALSDFVGTFSSGKKVGI